MSERGEEMSKLEKCMWVSAMILAASLAVAVPSAVSAQIIRQADVQILPGTLGAPCEPGDMQFGLFPCPPVERQGVFIHVRADDWKAGAFDGYVVTVTYRTAAGELKTATCGGDNPCPKRTRDWGKEWDDGWRTVAFQIGRVASGSLTGITIESVSVSKVAAPIVITIGKTIIGAP